MPLTRILTILLQLAGVSLICLALAHTILPRLLNWKADLNKLTLINKQVFIAHTTFIVVGIFLLGLVCLFFSSDLLQRSQLGLIGAGCFFMCWLSRLLFQFWFFTSKITGDATKDLLWRVGGTALWIFYTIVFGMILLYQLHAIGD